MEDHGQITPGGGAPTGVLDGVEGTCVDPSNLTVGHQDCERVQPVCVGLTLAVRGRLDWHHEPERNYGESIDHLHLAIG